MLATWHNHEWVWYHIHLFSLNKPQMWQLDLPRVLLNSPPSEKGVIGFKVWTTRGKATHCLIAIDIVRLKKMKE